MVSVVSGTPIPGHVAQESRLEIKFAAPGPPFASLLRTLPRLDSIVLRDSVFAARSVAPFTPEIEHGTLRAPLEMFTSRSGA